MKEAYKVVTAEYLDEHAIMIPFTRRLEKVCLGNLVAVISESVRCPSCHHSPAFIQPSCRATVPADRSQLFTRTTSRKHRLVSVSLSHYTTILLTNNPARENIAANARMRPSPFRGATAMHLYNIQYADRPDAIHNFRPLRLSAPPVTIYHPVFARFLQRMDEEPKDLSPEEFDRARDFVVAATDFYSTAAGRAKAFEETVRAHTEADDAV